MKPYGGGILTEARSAQMGFSITAEEALRFAASNPYVSCVIPGTDRLEYVRLNIAVGTSLLSMSSDERKKIIEKIDIKVKDYCRGCGYCLPCVKNIPIPTVLKLCGCGYCLPCVKNIPIPTVLKLYNRWQVFGGTDWSKMHQITEEYTSSVSDSQTADHCIGCGQCTKRCPFNLPIPDLMKAASANLRRYTSSK